MAAKTPWISVSATGEASLAPDVAVVSLTVSGTASDLAPAREDVNKRSSAVLARLRALDVADADISAPGVAIQPEYDYRKGQRLIGYRVARRMTARVRDLDRLGEVLDGVVAAGATSSMVRRWSPPTHRLPSMPRWPPPSRLRGPRRLCWPKPRASPWER